MRPEPDLQHLTQGGEQAGLAEPGNSLQEEMSFAQHRYQDLFDQSRLADNHLGDFGSGLIEAGGELGRFYRWGVASWFQLREIAVDDFGSNERGASGVPARPRPRTGTPPSARCRKSVAHWQPMGRLQNPPLHRNR